MSPPIQTIYSERTFGIPFSNVKDKIVNLFMNKGETIVLIPFATGAVFCLIDVFQRKVLLLPYGISVIIFSFALISIWGTILFLQQVKNEAAT